jgi:hypothetical protein
MRKEMNQKKIKAEKSKLRRKRVGGGAAEGGEAAANRVLRTPLEARGEKLEILLTKLSIQSNPLLTANCCSIFTSYFLFFLFFAVCVSIYRLSVSERFLRGRNERR